MSNEKENKYAKMKKIYAALTSVITSIILVKVFGIDFFLINLIEDFNKYDIKINQLDELIKSMFINNIKMLIVIVFVLRLKHGNFYKYLIVGLTTMACIFVVINVFQTYNTLTNSMSAIVMYVPEYINYYIYVVVQEKLDVYIEHYNYCNKFKDEVKPLLAMVMIVMSTSVILSFIQSLLAIIAI